jgi:hypothetical protein
MFSINFKQSKILVLNYDDADDSINNNNNNGQQMGES